MEKFFWENGVLSNTKLSGNPYVNKESNSDTKEYNADKPMKTKVEKDDGKSPSAE